MAGVDVDSDSLHDNVFGGDVPGDERRLAEVEVTASPGGAVGTVAGGQERETVGA